MNFISLEEKKKRVQKSKFWLAFEEVEIKYSKKYFKILNCLS
jgi:hypothetical protein